MKLTVHGARGSIPTSSRETIIYGGNTSCYELVFGKYQIFFDTGSGFRNVNFFDSSFTKCILYSHWHHDHIQGLPFNASIFNPDNSVIVSSALATRSVLRNTLQTYFSGGYFPVDIVKILPNLNYRNANQVKKSFADDFTLDWIELNHPGGCYGYSICHEGKKFTYLCDNEYESSQLETLTDFAEGSDLVIWDGMFTDAELESKKGWGHSSIEQAMTFFGHGDISTMLISHHAPSRTDDELDALAKTLPEGISFAKDGLEVTL